MRLFVTSRPDTEVTQQLQDLEPIAFSAHSLQTDADVDLYLDKYFAPHAPGGVLPEQTRTRLLQVSEGNWLYLDWVRQELERGRLDLDQVDTFPRGLGGAYLRAFQRYFPDPLHYTETARPLLELVAAACQPLLVDHIGRILGWNPYQRVSNIRILGSLLDRTGGSVALFHRSALDWLADPERSGDYFVDPEHGHRVLAEAGWREFQVDFGSMSAYMSRWLPTHLSIAKRRDDLVTCITDAPYIRRAFVEGRHFELTPFWQDAANHQFRETCNSSYDKLADSGGVTADLYEAARAIGGLFQACGVYDEAIAYFERCLQLALQDSDPDKMGYAHLDIGWCARHMEDFQRALGHVESALEWFRTSGNRVAEGGAESIRGICLWHLQRDEDALEALTHARDLSSSVKDKRGEAEALNHMGIVRRGLGDYEEALRCLHAAEEFYAKVKDLRGSGKCCNSLGTAYWWSGQHAKALQCYDAADGYNTRTNQRYVTGLTANDRGYLYIDLGRYREALDAFTSARSIRQALGTEGYEMMDISGLALAHHYLGDHQVARSLSNQALEGLRGITQIEDGHRAYFNHYLIHRNGSVEDQEAARRALAVAKQLVAQRIARLANPNVRQRFIDQVPLVRQVLAS